MATARMRLKDKVAIVTGGASGIGRATVELFVMEGAKVVIADTHLEKGGMLARQLGERALFVRADVSLPDNVQLLVDAAIHHFGGLDILFNNAAVPSAMHTSLLEEDFSDFDRVMRVNLLGVMLGTQIAGRYMAQHGGGAIINTGAISGDEAGFGLPCYRAAKAAVNHFTRSAAIELGPRGIRVNCISPGNIRTEMNAFTSPGADADKQRRWDEVRQQIRMAPQPLKREGCAADVAAAALFLASDDAAQITGIVLPVDGGITIGEVDSPLAADMAGLTSTLPGLNHDTLAAHEN